MRIFVFVAILGVCVSVFAGGQPDRVVIHLLDPRGAIDGNHTIPVGWQKGKADIIGTRLLNLSEGKALRELLAKELVDDDNVPFCGHGPAYAVTVYASGRTPTTVTLCGTCFTWAKAGNLRALHGKASLEFLDRLLPVPDVFAKKDGNSEVHLSPFGAESAEPFRLLRSVSIKRAADDDLDRIKE